VYEERAQKYLSHRHGQAYVPSPWFQYKETNETRVRYCQPDGLLFSKDLSVITIVEVKLKHTAKAWWQLKHKYLQVVRYCYPWATIHFVELVKWYDISIPFPEEVALRADLRDAQGSQIQVTIWKP